MSGKGVPMLLGEYLGRGNDDGLMVAKVGGEGGKDGDNGFAGADVTQKKPVHNFGG